MPTPEASCSLSSSSTGWVLLCFLLVLGMSPGLALFEAGLLRSRHTISIFTQIICGVVMNSLLWVIVGYSLTFRPGLIIGDLRNAFFINISSYKCADHAADVSELVYAMFQMMFAVISPLLLTGAYAERLKFKAFLIITFLWEVLIYYPLAHWIFNSHGFLHKYGVLDFAGGIVIHTSAGVSAVIISHYIGRREDFDEHLGESPPSNLPLAAVGVSFLWMGWFGFNAGCALSASHDAATAIANTQIAASAAACIHLLVSFFRHGHPNLTIMMNATVAGLAGITPAAGYIAPNMALLFGIILGLASMLSIVVLKERFLIDDALDVSSIHGVTGLMGSLMIGLFKSSTVDENARVGLFYGGGFELLGIQTVGVCAAIGYTFVMTYVIIVITKSLTQLRITDDEEVLGLDILEHKETAYHELMLDQGELQAFFPKHHRTMVRRQASNVSSKYNGSQVHLLSAQSSKQQVVI